MSGNASGKPRGLRALEDVLEGARDAGNVLAVIEALRALAIGGDVAAAKLYLDRMLGPVRPPSEEDLSATPLEELAAMAAQEPDVRTAVLDAFLSNSAAREHLRQRFARSETESGEPTSRE